MVKRRSRRASRNESCEISLSLSPSSSLSRVCLVLRPSPLSPIFLCGTSDYSLFPPFGSGKEMPLADGLNVSKLLFFFLSFFFTLNSLQLTDVKGILPLIGRRGYNHKK